MWSSSSTIAFSASVAFRARWRRRSLRASPVGHPPSPVAWRAAQARILSLWAATLSRRRGLLLSSLSPLTDKALAAEIASLQWEIVIETASHAYHAPKEDRARELAKLAASESPLDRYAAQLVRQWRSQDGRP